MATQVDPFARCEPLLGVLDDRLEPHDAPHETAAGMAQRVGPSMSVSMVSIRPMIAFAI